MSYSRVEEARISMSSHYLAFMEGKESYTVSNFLASGVEIRDGQLRRRRLYTISK